MARAGKLHDASGNLPDRWQEELSDDKLRGAAGDAGFKRGLAYFAQGRVKLAKSSLDDTANSATFTAMSQAGWLAALIPEEYGGSGLTLLDGCASIILTTSVQYSVERLSRGSLVVKPIWLLMTRWTVPPVK